MESLTVLQDILDFQMRLAEKTEPFIHLEPGIARERWQAGKPLLADESLAISPHLFEEALRELYTLLPEGEAAQLDLGQLLASAPTTSPHLRMLLEGPIGSAEISIQHWANDLSADGEILSCLLRLALAPFLAREAARYQVWIEASTWRRGYCPMCGSAPGMARLAYEDGRRMLFCTLCHTEWVFDRLRCPFCNSQPETGDGSSAESVSKMRPELRYFSMDGDHVYRVECCDRCGCYVKTVDERMLGRCSNLLIEDMVTAHLDIVAREQGYR